MNRNTICFGIYGASSQSFRRSSSLRVTLKDSHVHAIDRNNTHTMRDHQRQLQQQQILAGNYNRPAQELLLQQQQQSYQSFIQKSLKLKPATNQPNKRPSSFDMVIKISHSLAQKYREQHAFPRSVFKHKSHVCSKALHRHLTQRCKEMNLTIVLPHHTNKDKESIFVKGVLKKKSDLQRSSDDNRSKENRVVEEQNVSLKRKFKPDRRSANVATKREKHSKPAEEVPPKPQPTDLELLERDLIASDAIEMFLMKNPELAAHCSEKEEPEREEENTQ